MASHDVSALILAGGTSSRMGQAKQLLPLGDKSLLEQVIRFVLSFNFAEVTTVIGHKATQIQDTIQISDDRFCWVVHSDYLSGQGSSLRKGFNHCQCTSAMVFLGDQPFISKETVQLVLNHGLERQVVLDRPFAVRPSYQPIPGHPVFFGNVRKMDFSNVIGDRGAKEIIRRMKHRDVLNVEDRGVVFDIDTPEAYEKAKQISGLGLYS